ncbi:hypothetical protein FXO38_30002 [Capsicum annuum]|nr:hypothetical protein FXO38_30002 [Capsicum annuum]
MLGSQFRVDAFKFVTQNGLANGNFNRKKRDGYDLGKRKENVRTTMAQCEKVTQANVKLFSSTFVESLRLLDDYHHSTRIGFVEFVMVRAVIKERVQGVFCSDWTVENAKELVLKGWV